LGFSDINKSANSLGAMISVVSVYDKLPGIDVPPVN
jgi:hypothetical protein